VAGLGPIARYGPKWKFIFKKFSMRRIVIECFRNEIWFSFGKMPQAPNLGTDAAKAAA